MEFDYAAASSAASESPREKSPTTASSPERNAEREKTRELILKKVQAMSDSSFAETCHIVEGFWKHTKVSGWLARSEDNLAASFDSFLRKSPGSLNRISLSCSSQEESIKAMKNLFESLGTLADATKARADEIRSMQAKLAQVLINPS